MGNRDKNIDYLRFIGISLIILAHVSAPLALQQLRCFDVPLMIFITGLTASKKTISNYREHIWKRASRLLIPVYIFLTLFFLTLFIIQSLGDYSIGYLNSKKILHSFLLLEGIGYVWIIRVFLLLGIVTPLIVKFEKYCKNNIVYGCICIATSLINDLILRMHLTLPGGKYVNIFFTEFVMFLIGYIPLFMLGLRMRYAPKGDIKKYVFLIFLYFIIALFTYLTKHGFPIIISPNYKYPPQAYFIIYGAVASSTLWLIKDAINKVICRLKLSSLAMFIGENTIWIYLWHIPFVLYLCPLIEEWYLKYLIVYSSAVIVFAIQRYIVRKINQKTITKYFLG